RSALMFAAGDDPEAAAQVAELARNIGFDAVALRGLARARDLEPLAMLWISLSRGALGRGFALGLGLAHRERDGMHRASSKTRVARRIAVVGTGSIGGTLAQAFVRSGHDVRVSARDLSSPEIRRLIELGARAEPLSRVGRDAEVVALA